MYEKKKRSPFLDDKTGVFIKSMYQGREPLEHFAQQTFEFLSTEHGFVVQPLEHSVWSSILYYTKDLLAIEVSLAVRDNYASVNLLKLQNGKIPPHGYFVNEERIRIPLLYVLREVLHVHDSNVDALYEYLSISQERDFVTSLQLSRAIVVPYLDDIFREPLDALFPQTLSPTYSSRSFNM